MDDDVLLKNQQKMWESFSSLPPTPRKDAGGVTGRTSVLEDGKEMSTTTMTHPSKERLAIPGALHSMEHFSKEEAHSSTLSDEEEEDELMENKYTTANPGSPAPRLNIQEDPLGDWNVLDEVKEVPTFVIHPYGFLKRSLDGALVFCLLYTLYATPFQVGFNVDSTGVWFILELLTAGLLCVDLLTNVITVTVIKGVVITDPRGIFHAYVKSRLLFVDLFNCIPVVAFFAVVMPNPEVTGTLHRFPDRWSYLRVLRLVQLARGIRLWRIYVRWQSRFRINTGLYRLLLLGLLLVILSHVLACSWFMVALMQEDVETTWIQEINVQDSHQRVQYTAAIYWAIETLTTVGYGDVTAVTTMERIFNSFAMIIGVSAFSFTIGAMSHLVEQIEASFSTQDRIADVVNFLKYRRFPSDLQDEITGHYKMTWVRHRASQDQSRILGELSYMLRQKAVNFLLESVYKGNPLFEGTSLEFITHVIMQLQPQAAVPGDTIFEEGERGEEMYFINRGEVRIVDAAASVVYTTKFVGEYFGEIALFNPGGIRPASAVASTYCEFDVITRASYEQALKMFPEDAEVLDVFSRAQQDLSTIEAVHSRVEMANRLWDFSLIVTMAAAPGGVPQRSRFYKGKRFDNCFSARELVTWIVENIRHPQTDLILSRIQALDLARMLQTHGEIHNAMGPHTIIDGEWFFRFKSHQTRRRRSSINVMATGTSARSARSRLSGLSGGGLTDDLQHIAMHEKGIRLLFELGEVEPPRVAVSTLHAPFSIDEIKETAGKLFMVHAHSIVVAIGAKQLEFPLEEVIHTLRDDDLLIVYEKPRKPPKVPVAPLSLPPRQETMSLTSLARPLTDRKIEGNQANVREMKRAHTQDDDSEGVPSNIFTFQPPSPVLPAKSPKHSGEIQSTTTGKYILEE